MIALFEQKGIEIINNLTNEGNQEDILHKVNIAFHKYNLECNSCSWNVSYCEPSGHLSSSHLDITQESIFCPVCRKGKINSSKYPQYG